MNRTILIIILLSLTLILGMVYIEPKYQEFRDLEQKIEEKNAEIEKRDEYFQELRKTNQELMEYQEQLMKIDSALPDDSILGVATIFNFLNKAASQSGLTLKEVSLSAPSPVKAVGEEATKEAIKEEGLPSLVSQLSPETKETNVSFTVSGSYSSFKNFLSALEVSARLVEVESISFSSQGGVSEAQTGTETVETEKPQEFNLRIKVYGY